MAILGLGKNKVPFMYFDDFIKEPNWDQIHTEASAGIAKSHWHKKFVSSGVHKDWAEEEITTTFNNLKDRLTQEQLKTFLTFNTTDERIKYLTALTYVPHPFWLVFLRWNRRVESTGVFNKAVAKDCHWTDDAVHFPKLIQFIETLPFESIGRVVIFMTEANNKTVPHFDVLTEEQRAAKPHDDFIWFSTKKASKGVYVLDDDTRELHFPDPTKRFVWFNEMDFHGTDAVSHFSFSIRIDGVFNKELKDFINAGN